MPDLSRLLGLILVRDGYYPRLLPVCKALTSGIIYRKKCGACGARFSLLPNDVVPLHSYGLDLIHSRLIATLEGVPDRSRVFYESQQLLPDESPTAEPHALKATSWSDQLNDKPLRPSHQLFRLWRQKWPRRAQAWLHLLMLACVHVGVDLKSKLAQNLQLFASDWPAPMWSLALATGLVSLTREESGWAALPATIVLLSCRPAHKNFRAGGRPPPYYWGALEFHYSLAV